MKYVMFELDTGDGLKRNIPIIFPNSLVHADVAEAIKHMRVGTQRNWDCPFVEAKVVSAGELSIASSTTSGGSETLGVESRLEDSTIITMHDYFHGMKEL